MRGESVHTVVRHLTAAPMIDAGQNWATAADLAYRGITASIELAGPGSADLAGADVRRRSFAVVAAHRGELVRCASRAVAYCGGIAGGG